MMDYHFFNTDAKSPRREGGFDILIEQGFAATGGDWSFGEQLGNLSPGDWLLMYENRVGVVAIGSVLEAWDRKSHSPTLYFLPAEGFDHDHEYRIRVDWLRLDTPLSLGELKRRVGLGGAPRGAVVKIEKWRAQISQLVDELRCSGSYLPEEVTESSLYIEGALRRIMVNAYERDPAARRQCIAAHGTTCCVCGFSFAATYGDVADGYIHVHHLRPLSEVTKEHAVDPVEDLRPVCPNCHAVLHRRIPAFSIEEVRGFLR